MPHSDYVLGKAIGKGSFGSVFLARHRQEGRRYVVKKVNLASASKEERDSARHEAKLLSRLRHPNIIAYKESYMDRTGHLNIVMDFAEGGDLYTRIQEQSKARTSFKEETVIDWLVQLCLALQYIHSRKILHRDLKTQNIFLTKAGAVRVGDFGIARALESTADMAKTMIGTPYYMSPELCESRPYDYKSDVWAVGCVVYELCTLKHAFEARDLSGLVFKILKGEYPPMPSRYSADLAGLVRKCLSKDPAARPTVDEILAMPFVQRRIRKFVAEAEDSAADPSAPASAPAPSSAGAPRSASGSPSRAAPPDPRVPFRARRPIPQQQRMEILRQREEKAQELRNAAIARRKAEAAARIARGVGGAGRHAGAGGAAAAAAKPLVNVRERELARRRAAREERERKRAEAESARRERESNAREKRKAALDRARREREEREAENRRKRAAAEEERRRMEEELEREIEAERKRVREEKEKEARMKRRIEEERRRQREERAGPGDEDAARAPPGHRRTSSVDRKQAVLEEKERRKREERRAYEEQLAAQRREYYDERLAADEVRRREQAGSGAKVSLHGGSRAPSGSRAPEARGRLSSNEDGDDARLYDPALAYDERSIDEELAARYEAEAQIATLRVKELRRELDMIEDEIEDVNRYDEVVSVVKSVIGLPRREDPNDARMPKLGGGQDHYAFDSESHAASGEGRGGGGGDGGGNGSGDGNGNGGGDNDDDGDDDDDDGSYEYEYEYEEVDEDGNVITRDVDPYDEYDLDEFDSGGSLAPDYEPPTVGNRDALGGAAASEADRAQASSSMSRAGGLRGRIDTLRRTLSDELGTDLFERVYGILREDGGRGDPDVTRQLSDIMGPKISHVALVVELIFCEDAARA